MTFPPPNDSSFDAQRILESITDAFFALDTEWRFIYINNQAERLWGKSRTQLLGRTVWDEFPEAIGSTFDRQFHRAVEDNSVVSFEEFYPPLNAWLDVRVYPSTEGLSVFFQNVNERRKTEESLQQAGTVARDAQARLDVALAAGGIGTWTWNIAADRLFADETMARLFSVSAEDAAGGPASAYRRAIHPGDLERVIQATAEAIAHRNDYENEYRVLSVSGEVHWVRVRAKITRDAAGRPLTSSGIASDVTEQVERRQREQFLADLTARASHLTDPDDVISDAVRSVGEFLGVSRCIFADIDIEADTCTIHPSEYRADPALVSIAGVVSIASFGAFVVAEYAARRAVAVDDVRLDPLRAPAESLGAYEAIGIRAHVTVPVVHYDRIVSCMSIHSSTPRRWKLEEIDLLRTVVERTWLTVEVTRQDYALAREAETTVRVLETITDGFHAVDRAWNFTYVNQQAEGLVFRKGHDLIGKNLWDEFPEAVGTLFEQEYRRAVTEQVPALFEAYYPPLEAWLEVRAYPSSEGLSVFFQNVNERRRSEDALRDSEEKLRLATEGAGIGIWKLDPHTNEISWTRRCAEIFGLPTGDNFDPHGRQAWSLIAAEDVVHIRAALSKAVQEGTNFYYEYRIATPAGRSVWMQSSGKPYYDAAGKIARIEGVLIDITAQHEATERLAAAYQKERHVAEELQAALTPPVPERVPGLALAKYYEAALEEAGVGGDFYDIFPLEKGRTALVVGDLSGKGLAAATQVATVRNMLRYSVLRVSTLAGAITELNGVLAEQGLLTGFATLFIGAYDSGAGELTYVNCGQEPALVRRLSGQVEHLAPTGPILGSLPESTYEEQTIALKPRDTLAVFTDGLTEVGPSRVAMLGVEGVAEIFAAAAVPEAGSAEEIAEQFARSLIAGVDAAARNGVTRDDVCLLVAAIE